MKAKLIFDLPDDKQEFNLANSALDLCSFIWDFQQYLRGQWKYDGTDDIEKIYNKFSEIKENHNIDLDKLYS